MVAGHSGTPGTHFIYLFHMAIFFIASGYCFNIRHSKNIDEFIKYLRKKIKTLWFPYFFWMMVFAILHNYFIRINIYTDNSKILKQLSGPYINTTQYWTLKDILENIMKSFLLHGGSQIGGAMWFIATLFELVIVYCLIDTMLKYFNKNTTLSQGLISIIFLGIGFSLSIMGKTLFGFSKVFSYYILYYLGYLCKRCNIYKSRIKPNTHIIIFSCSMLVLFIMNKLGSIDLGANSYVNPLYLLIVSFAGWQFLYEIAELIKKNQELCKILIVIGQNTLPIIIFHFLCFKLVNYVQVVFYKKPHYLIAAFPTLYTFSGWWIAYIIIGVTIPVLISLTLKIFHRKLKTVI